MTQSIKAAIALLPGLERTLQILEVSAAQDGDEEGNIEMQCIVHRTLIAALKEMKEGQWVRREDILKEALDRLDALPGETND